MKYRILVTYRNHNYLARVLAQRTFLFVSYWRVVVQITGSRIVIEYATLSWCKEFDVAPEDVEDLTKWP